MESEDLVAALEQLDALARAEYHLSLEEVASQPGDDDERRLLRLGRLIGVTLKEPFADPRPLRPASRKTGAHRAWDLRPKAAFEEPSARASWQYEALQALSDDAGVVRTLGWRPADAYALATMAQDERGFFWFLAISCRDYLCESRELREQVDRQVTAMRRAGQGLLHVTPEFLVASGGLKLASVLVASVPALGAMGVPLIGGLVFVMYSVGTDAFCAWTGEHQHYHANFPNADGNV